MKKVDTRYYILEMEKNGKDEKCTHQTLKPGNGKKGKDKKYRYQILKPGNGEKWKR